MTRLSTMRRYLVLTVIAIAAMASVAVPSVGAQSASAEDLFARASVDDERPYLGQQITYSLRIYQKQDADLSFLSVSSYTPPDFAGFWNSQEYIQDEYEDTIGASRYSVVEVRTVLFAIVAGARDIKPAVMQITSMTSSGVRIENLASPPVAVEIRPLPTPEPSGFTGAVGRLEISAQADATAGRLNEPVRLTVRIAGEGNIEALPDPEWPAFPGWRVIESPVSKESQLLAGQIAGSRTYQMVLMPEQSGGLTIPEIRYPYFDPALDRYIGLATTPITMSIADVSGSTAAPSVPAVVASKGEVPQVRPIKAAPPSLSQANTELAGSAAYWAAWTISALAIAGALAWRRRQVVREAVRAQVLRDSALSDARTALAHAVSSGVDPSVFASEAMLAYVSARLETPVNGLTREVLIRRLREAGVPPDLEERVRETLAAGESARYIPPGGSPGGAGNHAQRTSRLLGELEEAIGA